MLHAFIKSIVYLSRLHLFKPLAMLYERIVQNDNISYLAVSTPESTETIHYGGHGTLSDTLLWNAFKNRDELAFEDIYLSDQKLYTSFKTLTG